MLSLKKTTTCNSKENQQKSEIMKKNKQTNNKKTTTWILPWGMRRNPLDRKIRKPLFLSFQTIEQDFQYG